MENNKPYPVPYNVLKSIEGVKFRPRILKEYFMEDGIEWRNGYVPSPYSIVKGLQKRKPKIILSLILQLVNYDIDFFEYLINWIASFFKSGFKKSRVAVALIGDQGAGKGLLFYIISSLIGKQYCITINDESLNSKFKAKLFENMLFINFDEITYRTAKNNDSVLKPVITNDSVSLEEKGVTMEREIELHAQCLFTSNHAFALNIEESDRRYTVFTTGPNIEETNFLGLGSSDILMAAIDSELEDFAKYLKNYDVDVKLAKKPLDTPEKRAIINASKDHIIDYHSAIVNMNISYFSELQEIDPTLYQTMRADFKKGYIDRVNITKAYNAMFSKKVTTNELLGKLRLLKPYNTFSLANMHEPGSHHYFILK